MSTVARQFGSSSAVKWYPETGSTLELLWENEDPTSSFAAQTISLDLSSYDAVYVFFGYTNGDVFQRGMMLIDSATNHFRYTGNSSNNIRMFERTATANTSGVAFSDGTYRTQGSAGTSNTGNSYMIPFAIYGIKF